MIREYNLGGFYIDKAAGDVQGQVNRALENCRRRTLPPGTYDITPGDTRFTSYESLALRVVQDGTGEIVGRRKPQSVGTGLLLTELVENGLKQVAVKVHTEPVTGTELLTPINAEVKSCRIVTLDVEHFLATQEERRILWGIYAYIPGGYPVIH